MLALQFRERWKLFRLETDRRFLVFILLAFFLNLGFGCGMASANALLVSRVGTEPLFFVYLGSSILTFLLAGATYFWVDRHARERIFILSFASFAACIFLLWAGVTYWPAAVWPIFAARILSDVFFVLALLQFWLLAGDHFSNLEAKLRFPLLVAASGLGYLVGGLLLNEFAAQLHAINFFLVWGSILALLPFFLWLLPRKQLASLPDAGVTPGGENRIPASAFRLLKVLFLFWLLFTFFIYGVDYFFNTVALKAFPDENRLAAFFGQVAYVSLAAVFVFQIFLAGPLAKALSVDRSLLIICFALFLGTGLVAWNPSLGTVAFSEGLLFYFLDSKAVSILQPVGNLFPDKMRGRVKVLLDGFAPSSGDILLLIVALGIFGTLGTFHLIDVLAGASVLFLLYPWVFGKAYLKYLMDCLRSPDPKMVLNAVQALGENDKKSATPALFQLLEQTGSLPLKRHIILSLGRMRNEAALPKIVEQFSQPHEILQLAVIESLGSFRNYSSLFALYELMKSQDNVSFQVRMSATLLMARLVGGRMIPLLQEALQEEDERIRANAIESLATIRSQKIIPLVQPFLQDANRRLRANAAIALYPFRAHRAAARTVIVELFQSPDSLTRFAGIYAIGELGLKEFEKALIVFLDHPDQRHRQQVLTALAKMGNRAYAERFAAALADADAIAALESLRNLARFPPASRWLVFEIVSKMELTAQEKILARLDQTPFDFSQERELLTSRREMIFLQKR